MTTLNPTYQDLRPKPIGWMAILLVLAYALVTSYLLSKSLALAFLPLALSVFFVPFVRNPKVAPAVLLFLVPLLSGMPRGMVVPIFRINEILLGVTFATYMLVILMGPKKRFETTFLDRAFILLLLARSILPLVTHPLEFMGDPTKLVKFFLAPLQYYMIYRLVLGTIKTKRAIFVILRVMVAAAVIVAVVGLMQALRFPGIAKLYSLYYPSAEAIYTFVHSARVTSLFHSLSAGTTRFHGGGWNPCGFYLAQSLLIGLLLHRFDPSQTVRRLLIPAMALIGLVMILTFSFTTAITLLLFFFFVGYQQGRLKKYILLSIPAMVFLVLMAAIFFGDAFKDRMQLQFSGTWIPHTLLVRIDFWLHRALPQIAKHLVLGFGPSKYDWVAAESAYLFVIANCGIVGLAGFIGFIVVVWRNLARRLREHSLNTLAGGLLLLALGLLLQITAASTTGQYFEYSGSSENLWAIWTMALVASRLPRKEPPA